MTGNRRHETIHIAALMLAGMVLYFYRLGAPGLMDPDEGRYAEIAREMLLLKDWIIPHLNLLPYLEKPPLVYWLTGLSFQAQGLSEWAARLPAAVSALGGVFLAFFLGRTLWGARAGWLSALILATCGGYVALGRLIILDMPLTLFFNLGVGLGYLALIRERPGLWIWAYLALALGVLTKGPVVLVLAAGIWGAWCWSQSRPLIRSWLRPWGLALLIAVCLPWFVLVAQRYPDFLRFFILEQHLGRFLTKAIHHHQPVYFYLPVLLGFMLPWSWLLPWAVGRERPGKDPRRLFLLIWAGAVLLFFSLSRGKLAPYILPSLLPLALLLGQGLADLERSGGFAGSRGFWCSLMLWAFLAWGLLGFYFWPPDEVVPLLAKGELLKPLFLPGLLILALTPTIALIWRRPGVLAAGALMFSLLVPWGMEKISAQRSPRELGLSLKSHWRPGGALVGYRLYSQGLSFYSGQVFHLLSFATELDYGRKLAGTTSLFFDTPQEMAAFVRSRPGVFFFLRDEEQASLERELPGKFSFLGRWKNYMLMDYDEESLRAGRSAEEGKPADG
ncbi:MAG: phospholipid carrier-dependent glycosyltransferase [Deltaproteobacteria bacterium]|nr:MAG: phospholipid carrier-dependent glycosyltransferase [Deltaproteobacteria bacterium]